MNLRKQNILLIFAIVLLTLLPFVYASQDERSFPATDDQAKDLIMEINPEYEPWIDFFWKPNDETVEALLFALQAAIGSGLLFYYLGYRSGSKKKESSDKHEHV